ncbi:histidine phosphatase family protein [soil metagenome]
MIATTEILLIRHGETEWNAAKRLQGHIDIPLSPAGERQAAALAERLKQERLDAIVASDLQRASQTACAIALGQSLPVQLDPGLRERCYGAFEGLQYSDIAYRFPEAHAAWQTREVDTVFPAGERVAESLRQFQQRSIATILRYAQQHQGKKIALVAHGGVLECAYRMALSLPLDTPRTFPIPNASINRFTEASGVLMLHTWGDVAHLADDSLDDVDARLP